MTAQVDPPVTGAEAGAGEPLPRLNTLWVEGALTYVEQVCLLSAVRLGHPVTLYTYFGVDRVPPGVEVRDGREVMAEARLLKHREKNSWSLGSNLFRYQLMREARGVWIDADLYFLKPLRLDGRELLFGWQKPGLINGAVFYASATHPLIDALFAHLGREHLIPHWLPWHKRIFYELRPRLGLRPLTLEEHRWGIAGPRAITYVARELDLLDHAVPADMFYPYGPKRARDAFDPAVDIRARLTPRTVTVHLWNEIIKSLKTRPPPAGSFIAEICAAQEIAQHAAP
ncbi:MAG: hypothetical protein ACLFU0_07755 [Alphaproteobacteria bacterium]